MLFNSSSIFHPDIFRHRTTSEGTTYYSNVAYDDGSSFSNMTDTFQKFRIGQLLESILLYDQVYIELSDLILVLFMLGKEYEALKEIISTGQLRFVNKEEVSVTSTKDRYLYRLGAVKQNEYLARLIKDEQDLHTLIDNPGWIPGKLHNLVTPLIKHAVSLEKRVDKIIIESISEDLKKLRFRQAFQIQSSKPFSYAKNDAVRMNRLSESYYRSVLCSELGISNIFLDDVLLNTIQTKAGNIIDMMDTRFRRGFQGTTNLYNVPNIPRLFAFDKISLSAILELKQSPGYTVFRMWLGSKITTDRMQDINDITRDLINEVEKKASGLNSRLIKSLRIAMAVYLGFEFHPVVGAAFSVIDSVFIDYFLSGRKSPKLFLDDYYKMAIE